MRDARAHAWVGLEEVIHAVLVSSKDHHELVPLVLHHLHQDVDALLAVVLGVFCAVQGVGLVDEQHSAHRALENLLGLRRGVSDVLTHKVIAHGMHEMTFLQVAKPVEQVGHHQRNCGLPGSRRPGEAHMQVRPGRRQPEPLPRPVDQQQRTDFLHLFLHRDEPDQFGVQCGEQVIDACGPPFTDEGDGGIRLERFVPPASPPASGGLRHRGPRGCRPPGMGTRHPPGHSTRKYGRHVPAQAWIHHVGTPHSFQPDTACGEAFRACLAPPVPSHQDYRHDEDSGAGDGSELHMTQPQPGHQQGRCDAEQEYAESGISKSGRPHIEGRVARRLAAGQSRSHRRSTASGPGPLAGDWLARLPHQPRRAEAGPAKARVPTSRGATLTGQDMGTQGLQRQPRTFDH